MPLAVILTLFALSARPPCLPPGISPDFLSWPSHRVVTGPDAAAIPGDTTIFRDTVTAATVMIVEVDGVLMIVDPSPEAPQIDFWVRVLRARGDGNRLTASPCAWQRTRER